MSNWKAWVPRIYSTSNSWYSFKIHLKFYIIVRNDYNEYYINQGDKFIKKGDIDKAKDSYLDARKLAKQLASFYSDLNSSFKGVDARIPNEMQKKGNQILQILSESNQRLDSLYIKTEKPEVAVPLLVETIRIMSPTSIEGKEAYERLLKLGFVETKYKG